MQNPTPHTDPDLDRTIFFWERGPVRRMVEDEFDIELMRQLAERNIMFDVPEERRLHDRVVPEAFLFVAEHLAWTAEEQTRGLFSPEHRTLLQQHISTLLCRELDTCVSHQVSRSHGPFSLLLVACRWLPGTLRKFLSP